MCLNSFIQSCRKDSDVADLVPAKEANVICPQLVIAYLAQKVSLV